MLYLSIVMTFPSDCREMCMEKEIADELIRVLKKNESSDFEESFERAFELTKAYAASANAQASAIPFVFEKMFELFVCGKTVK